MEYNFKETNLKSKKIESNSSNPLSLKSENNYESNKCGFHFSEDILSEQKRDFISNHKPK